MSVSELPVGADRPQRTARLRTVGARLLAWAAGALVFFRGPIFSGFRLITGDNGDARLIVYLHEHWIDVLRGRFGWRSPGFYFPTTDTLAYSDSFVLNEVFYAPLRLCGMDPYLAFQWTLMLTSLVGFLGCSALCRRILGGHEVLCGLLGLVFTFANMLYVQAGHPQLASIYWVPVVVLLVLRWRTDNAAGRQRGAALAAFGTGALISTLLLSTFYVGWFLLLVGALWVATMVLLGARPRPRWTDLPAVAACGIGSAVGLVPFLVVYLPAANQAGRSLTVALAYAAQPRDLFNLGRRNYFWSPLTTALYGPSSRLSNGEFGFGLTPLTLLGTLIGIGYLARRLLGRRTVRDRAALSTVVVLLVSVLLPVRAAGWSPWQFIWNLPGAYAIRAIDRMAVLSDLLAVLVVAFAVAHLLRRTSPVRLHRTAVVVGAVLSVMVVEQFNIGTNAGIDRTAQLAALAVVPAPPPACHSFYLAGVPAGRSSVTASIDAMAISQRTGLPTLNGYSGLFPPGYGAVWDPGGIGYRAAVRQWVTDHQLTGVCGYDQSTRNWSLPGGQDGLK